MDRSYEYYRTVLVYWITSSFRRSIEMAPWQGWDRKYGVALGRKGRVWRHSIYAVWAWIRSRCFLWSDQERTRLMEAAPWRRTSVIRLLLRHGTSKWSRDKTRNTASKLSTISMERTFSDKKLQPVIQAVTSFMIRWRLYPSPPDIRHKFVFYGR